MLISITLPEELLQPSPQTVVLEEGLVFRLPSQEEAWVAANRLLKFKLPPRKLEMVIQPFVLKFLREPKLSKLQMSRLPGAAIAYCFQQLLAAAVSEQPFIPTAWDRFLTAYFLEEELLMFRASVWALDEIAQQADSQTHPLFSVILEEDFQQVEAPDAQRTMLRQLAWDLGYHVTDAQQSFMPLEAPCPFTLFLRLQGLAFPLPWMQLLSGSISGTMDSAMYPHLHRGQMLLSRLGGEEPATRPLLDWLTADRVITQSLSCVNSPKQLRPVRCVVLVEGETELLLLPQVARMQGINLLQEGILLYAVGGKSQMLPHFERDRLWLNVPIAVLLDSDAQSVASQLAGLAQPPEHLLTLAVGEIEDTLPDALLIETINQYYDPFPKLTLGSWQMLEMADALQRPHLINTQPINTEKLELYWKQNHWGMFDKVDFARKVVQTMSKTGLCPEVLTRFVTQVQQLALQAGYGV